MPVRAAHAELILVKTFAICAERFVIEGSVRDERVVAVESFRARGGIEVENVERFLHGL